jgi:hypothetical protein
MYRAKATRIAIKLYALSSNNYVDKTVDSGLENRPCFVARSNTWEPVITKGLFALPKMLSKLNAEADTISQLQAQLQQTICSLKVLTNSSDEVERSLTDVIRIVVKAADGYVSAAMSCSPLTQWGRSLPERIRRRQSSPSWAVYRRRVSWKGSEEP